MELLDKVIEYIFQKHGIDVVVMDFTSKDERFTDYFVICSGLSAIQTRAIADNIVKNLKKEGYKHYHMEGYENGSWILVDIGEIVVHIFLPETREFYDIEGLWSDVEKRKVEDDKKTGE